MNKYIKIFIDSLLSTEGSSKNTIDSYTRDLEKLEEYFNGKNILYLKQEELENYFLDISKKFSNKSIDRYISSIKHFYDFLQLEKIIKKNPSTLLEHKKKEFNLPNFLNEKEVEKLLDKAKNESDMQFYCMIELLYATGMRISELVSLEISSIEKDFNLKKDNNYKIKNYLRIVGKGNKERIIPITKNAILILENYLKKREELLNGNYSKYLFTTMVNFKKNKSKIKKEDKYVTRQVFARKLKDLAIKSNINPYKISPHTIRHSIATHLLKNGVDIRIIQQILGHSDISTTQIYTHLNNKIKKSVIEKHHPLSKINKIEY